MLIKNFLSKITPQPIFSFLKKIQVATRDIMEIRELILSHQTNQLQNSHSNPLNSFGKKCFHWR